MAQISNYKPVWRVYIIESEWGQSQRIEGTKYFDTEQEALEFEKSYNSRNTKRLVPDWYMYATTPVKIR